jgi:uncharacterized protein (TIGR03435 family)
MFAQSTEPLPLFEAADIHASPRTVNPQTRGGFVRGGRYEFRQATMLDLIANAYNVEADKVLGGPSWLETDRFDIIAKAPSSANNDSARLMLRALLADRFKLTIHNEDRPSSVYAVTAITGKRGPQLKESGGGPNGCQGVPQTPTPGVIPYNVVACHNMTMEGLAAFLRQAIGGYFDQPVVDATGLQGNWDFELKWTGRGQLAAAGSDGISAFDALEKQLGLKAELQKRPAPVVVVDRVNQKPTDNLPDVAQKLPVIPTEFEVGDVKPSMPGTPQRGGFQPGGRIDIQGFTLKRLMTLAWDLEDDMLVGPKWIESDRFNIVAKAPADVSIAANNIDVSTLQGMLKNLLVDRFKIKMHTEDQPVAVFALVAPKRETKLKKADQTARANCKRTIAQGGPVPVATVVCQNTTMSQLVEKLPGWAGAYVTHPAIDSTGLEGGWDFSFSWIPRANFEAAPRPENAPQPGAAPVPSDPNGGLSLFEAIEKLGLKLEQQKHPLPVIVIDSANQNPTEN